MTKRSKTRPRRASVKSFLAAIDDLEQRKDCRELDRMLRRVTGAKAKLWGPNVVGYGSYHYRYASGHEGDCFLAGFSPRTRELTVYVMSGFKGHASLLRALGRHRKGKSCLYLRDLASVDQDALERLLRESVRIVRERYA